MCRAPMHPFDINVVDVKGDRSRGVEIMLILWCHDDDDYDDDYDDDDDDELVGTMFVLV